MKPPCIVEDCDDPRISTRTGMCNKHHKRFMRNGDVTPRKFWDTEESFAHRTERRGECLIWTGWTTNTGYGAIRFEGKDVLAHRYAWERVNGPIPDGMMVDHRDHCDTRCVEVNHLRLATHAQNNTNRSGPNPNSKLGVRNVMRSGSKYRVRVGSEDFGAYLTLEEAEQVAERARQQMYGEYAGRGKDRP